MFWKRPKKALSTGEAGEEAAATFLRREGYRILERNSANKHGKRLGEIDIIAREGREIVFVEVKTSLAKPGVVIHPELRVDRHKLERLQRAAALWLANQSNPDLPYRFDVVAVLLHSDGKSPTITHFDHVFL